MALAAEPWPHPIPSAWIGWSYLVIAGSVISFTSYVIAVRTLPITVVTTYAYVNPLIAGVAGAGGACTSESPPAPCWDGSHSCRRGRRVPAPLGAPLNYG